MLYDVIIVGGGPAGLSAALNLGRARRRVLLCDSGTPRNAAAERVQGFVTRDGTPPAELRRIARAQLAPYDTVEVRDARVEGVDGESGELCVELAGGRAVSRSVLLCTGMVDDVPEMPGYRELWGKAIFQCPYCHGWEVRDRAFGLLVATPLWLDWSLFLLGWSRDVIVFTDRQFEVPGAERMRLTVAGIRVEERRLRRLVTSAEHGGQADLLVAVELEDGSRIEREVLFAHPPQRQTALVTHLGLALDSQGFVRVNERGETSRRGIYAAGDLTSPLQSAVVAAAAGAQAAYALNHALAMELAAASAAER